MNAALRIRVAKAGDADFGTIGEALASIPRNFPGATEISIAPGVYSEKLRIENPRVSLLGSGRNATIISFDDHALRLLPSGERMNTFNSYTLYVGASDFSARDLCVANPAGEGRLVGQAVACHVDADRAGFCRCGFKARQDTLCLGPLPSNPLPKGLNLQHPANIAAGNGGMNPFRQYFRDCLIEGDVDFIFGSAAAVFQGCLIRSLDSGDGVKGYIAAPSTLPGQAFGFVFLDCRLEGPARKGSAFLARPWRRSAKAAYIGCWMGEHISTAGWDNWGDPDNEKSAEFVESGSHGPGAPAGQDSGRRAGWAHSLDAGKASRFSPQAVLSCEDGWSPWKGMG